MDIYYSNRTFVQLCKSGEIEVPARDSQEMNVEEEEDFLAEFHQKFGTSINKCINTNSQKRRPHFLYFALLTPIFHEDIKGYLISEAGNNAEVVKFYSGIAATLEQGIAAHHFVLRKLVDEGWSCYSLRFVRYDGGTQEENHDAARKSEAYYQVS